MEILDEGQLHRFKVFIVNFEHIFPKPSPLSVAKYLFKINKGDTKATVTDFYSSPF